MSGMNGANYSIYIYIYIYHEEGPLSKRVQLASGYTTPHQYLRLHLADAFIQSDLHCIQVTVLHLISSCFPWESNP